MRANARPKGNEFIGSIGDVRAIEDCIRATKKYTEGVQTIRKVHPIQGEDFPSKEFCKLYEVYPDVEVSWDMPVGVAIEWLWRDVTCIDVLFKYDYRTNRAIVLVRDGPVAVRELEKSIPHLSKVMTKVTVKGTGTEHAEKQAMGAGNRSRAGVIPDTQPMAHRAGH